MANRAAAALGLGEGDREVLARLTRATSGRAGLAQRARIVLLAADGESNTAIADRGGVSRPTVIGWRSRYAERGLTGLDDDQRSGPPRMIEHRRIVSVTLAPPPKKFGVTHWSSRLLGQHSHCQYSRGIDTPDAASLLPAPLAATRTGLTSAGDDELTTTDHLHTMISCLLGARKRETRTRRIRGLPARRG